jgi:hypothetical protein
MPVPFALLWTRVLKESQATTLHRRLRRLLSLLLQLVILSLILFGIADPHLGASARGRSLVLLIDTSASMQALTASGRTRLEEAKAAARGVVAGLRADDLAMVVALEGRPSPEGGLTADEHELYGQIDGLWATDTPGDVERALRLCADALSGRDNPTIVWITDGAYDAAALERLKLPVGVDVRYLPVGGPGPGERDNVAVTALSVRRYRANQTAYEVLVEVASFAERALPVELELFQDGEVVEAERISLEPGARVQRIYPNLAGEGTLLSARLSRAHASPDDAKAWTGPGLAFLGERIDAFSLDDRAYAVLPPRHKQKVLLVTGGNLFLEGALLLDQNLEVEKVAPAAYEVAATSRYDAVVLDRVVPAEAPKTHALYVDPEGKQGPFQVRGTVVAPYVNEIRRDHPVMRWVTLKDLNVSRALTFGLEAGDVALASSARAPILVARERGGRKTVALGFALEKSDLPLRVAFPVLLINTLEWFAGGDAGVVDAYVTGRPLRLPLPASALGHARLDVRRPDGKVGAAPVQDGRLAFYADFAGCYELEIPSAPRRFAVNLQSGVESKIAPRAQLTIGGVTLPAPEPARLGVGLRRAVWPYLVALVLCLALGEWWTYNRRVTV